MWTEKESGTENGGGDWRFLLCFSCDDPEMPTNVWLMGSVFRTRRQDYVYNNCLPDNQTMREEAAVSFRMVSARMDFQKVLCAKNKRCLVASAGKARY